MPDSSALAVAAELPASVVLAWFTLVGAAVGSFLNVVIARVPAGESVVRPRSRCPGCRSQIAWYDNLPVLSWLILRGRCRRCAARISIRYPAVELLVAGAGFLAAWRHGLSVEAVLELVFVAILLALAFIDKDTWTLPYELTVPLIVVGQAASGLGWSAAPSPASSAAGTLVGWGAFALVAFIGEKLLRKEALGHGDVWLLAGIGAWLGAGALLPVVLLASTQGAVVGIALILLGRGEPGPAESPAAAPVPPHAAAEGAPGESARGEEDWVPPRYAVPFGPFLVLAALEWLYLSEPLSRLVPIFSPFV